MHIYDMTYMYRVSEEGKQIHQEIAQENHHITSNACIAMSLPCHQRALITLKHTRDLKVSQTDAEIGTGHL
jgi:hypothetical protein